MNLHKKCFVFLEFIVQLLSVVSYTVVLKQVKPLYPPVKVYRYELRQPKIWQDGNTQYIHHKLLPSQRLYPVPVKLGRDENYKLRVPVKKEKKFNKVNVPPEKSVLRDPHLSGLSQHLVPPVSNQILGYPEAKEEESREEENGIRPLLTSPQTGKSFASFGQEKGKIYKNPGDWAVPVPQADSSSSENNTEGSFTPSQLYLQIRHKNTVIHVPQSEALKDAETLEELINAPRLKELARTTHVQETYSEEGYEDAAYDHAGHTRQAQHGEVYDAKDEGKFKIKEAPIILDYDSDLEETKKVPLQKEIDLPGRNSTNKLESRITSSRLEVLQPTADYTKIPKNYKGEHKYSSRVRNEKKNLNENNGEFNLDKLPGAPVTFPSYFGEMPPTPQIIIPQDSTTIYTPPVKKSSKYRKTDFNSTKIHPVSELPPAPVKEFTDFKPYISAIDSQASPSTKSLKYSKIYSKKTKQLRLEPLKNEKKPVLQLNPYVPPHEDSQSHHSYTTEEEPINQRIVLPTIGYINSLTTAHFGKGNSMPVQSEVNEPITGSLNLTQALNYLRTNKNQQNQQNQEVSKPSTEIDVRSFEPMKLKKLRPDFRKTKRDVYVTGEGNLEGDDESDLPHNEKNEEILEDERERIKEENLEKEIYEAQLKQEISRQEKEILKETLKNIGAEDEEEIFPQFSSSNFNPDYSVSVETTTTTPVNVKKYPFYLSKRLPENSPLRYATDPKQFPKKTGYKMEFYESREKLIQCPDFHPHITDLPNSNSSGFNNDTEGNERLIDVGSKIACLRMKYFDPEPFDNPIFKEKEIDYVGKNPKTFKKVPTKVKPRKLELNKKDQKFQSSNHHNFNSTKLEKNNKLNFSTIGKPSNKQNQVIISEEIKNFPTKPIKAFSTTRPTISSKTKKGEIIPTKKLFNELSPFPPQNFLNKSNLNSGFGLKTIYNSQPKTSTWAKASANKNQLIKPHNCLPNISQIAALDGTKNLTIDCNDATLIQKVYNNIAHLQIIPKRNIKLQGDKKNEPRFSPLSEESDWIPMVGYTLPKNLNNTTKPISRRTDELTKLIKDSSLNASSNHYVIDELKEDENVRKGEVMEDMDHYLKLMEDELQNSTFSNSQRENSTRKRRQAENGAIKAKTQNDFAKKLEFSFNKPTAKNEPDETQPKQTQVKRPFNRLTGLDFLVRYHKNKNKHSNQKAEDFWKITTSPTTDKKNLESKKPTSKSIKNKEEKSDKSLHETSSNGEKTNKTKDKEITEPQKTNSVTSPPEKITKKPEPLIPKIIKSSTQNIETEKISSIRSHNFTKIITKISRESSETSEKPRIIYKHSSKSFQNFTTDKPKLSAVGSDNLQYTTLNRTSNYLKNHNTEQKSTEKPLDPVLYYIVNLKTGRGKWVTNYDEQRAKGLGKYQKRQKLKDNVDTKKDKRRKRLKT